MSDVEVRATGICLPGERVGSAAIDARLGLPEGWLEQACGVRTRTVAAPAETQEAMAAGAARAAIDAAGIDPDTIDLLLFAAAVGRQPIPATAPLVKGLLGLTRPELAAFDINATCLGALVAMDLARHLIGAGRARHVLVVSAEIASRALPWSDDPATAGLFGDGAAAVLLGPATPGGGPRLGHFAMETWPEGYEACQLGAGGTRFDLAREREDFERHAVFRMNGHELFRLSRKRLPAFVERLLATAGWRADDVDLVLPHQASPLAIEHMIRACGFARERVLDTVRETGNLVAASLPVTLHCARAEGRIRPGAKLLMLGTSAGMSVAGMTLRG